MFKSDKSPLDEEAVFATRWAPPPKSGWAVLAFEATLSQPLLGPWCPTLKAIEPNGLPSPKKDVTAWFSYTPLTWHHDQCIYVTTHPTCIVFHIEAKRSPSSALHTYVHQREVPTHLVGPWSFSCHGLLVLPLGRNFRFFSSPTEHGARYRALSSLESQIFWAFSKVIPSRRRVLMNAFRIDAYFQPDSKSAVLFFGFEVALALPLGFLASQGDPVYPHHLCIHHHHHHHHVPHRSPLHVLPWHLAHTTLAKQWLRRSCCSFRQGLQHLRWREDWTKAEDPTYIDDYICILVKTYYLYIYICICIYNYTC